MRRLTLTAILLLASASVADDATPKPEAPKKEKEKEKKVARSTPPQQPAGDPPSLTVHDDLTLEGPLTSTDVAGIVFDRHYALVDCWVKNARSYSRPTHIYLQMRIDKNGEVIAAGFEPA